jgi:heme oxygenase
MLEVLRQTTADRHAHIDNLLGLRKPFGRAHYARTLQGFAAFLTAWEPAMAAVLPPDLQAWFAQGRRLVLLEADLLHLGVAAPTLPVNLPALDSRAAALGSLYVLEGSALGGQFIAAQVRRTLGLSPERGAAYFHGAGPGTAARWREFQVLLAAEPADALTVDQASHAAVRTFQALIDIFEILLHERAAA